LAKVKETKKIKSKKEKQKDENYWRSDEAREEYVAEMAKKGATLPKGFIKDAKANTGH
tara:strand:- start:365 stop:538 length:174 start_codon:yes stop_codon:yes gene_type:complete